ncbi:MAG: AAA family ATPase [Acidobacteriota bacterium]
MKKLPLGISTFSDIVRQGRLYVDKTRWIHKLVAEGGKYFFLSRPRRFGKSLLVSTLKEIFEGNRDLFAGLWIHDKLDWTPNPVIRLDCSAINYDTPDALKSSLVTVLSEIAAGAGLALDAGDYKMALRELILRLSARGRVALLVDEYDKPLVDFVDVPEIAAANRDVLRSFYSTIKGCDEYLQFVLVTGVSKFSRVSLFSGLNNLDDITVDDRFSTLLGWTEDELQATFAEWIDVACERMGIGRDEMIERVREWYNGYSWDGRTFVYNPQSILSLFSKMRFGNFWFETGTPSFLLKMIRQHDVNIGELEAYVTDDSLFETYDVDRMNVPSLLFQSGYLTVKHIKTDVSGAREYTLSYPNREVRESLLKHILADFSKSQTDTAGLTARRMAARIARHDLEGFFALQRSVRFWLPSPTTLSFATARATTRR